MNTAQCRIFELLEKKLPNESLSTVKEYRLGVGGLPVYSVYLDDSRCRSFMAFIPMGDNFTEEETIAIVRRLCDCVKVECILRDHRFSVGEAWKYYISHKEEMYIQTDNPLPKQPALKCECCPEKGPIYGEDGKGEIVCSRCGLA